VRRFAYFEQVIRLIEWLALLCEIHSSLSETLAAQGRNLEIVATATL
jgi:hypothetical protein